MDKKLTTVQMEADWIGRRKALIQNAGLMALGLVWLTFGLWGQNELFTYLLGAALGLYGMKCRPTLVKKGFIRS